MYNELIDYLLLKWGFGIFFVYLYFLGPQVGLDNIDMVLSRSIQVMLFAGSNSKQWKINTKSD